MNLCMAIVLTGVAVFVGIEVVKFFREEDRFYRQKREEAIASFWRKFDSSAAPIEVLLRQLANELYRNRGCSAKWKNEFVQVDAEARRKWHERERARAAEDFYSRQRKSQSRYSQNFRQEEQGRKQQRFYQESQTVPPSNGINLDAYYRIFGLTPETLTAESLKKAYRSLCLQYHPDRNSRPDAAAKFDKVHRVYEALQRELAQKSV